ncbi:MAG: sterol carrier family protein [Mycobacteriales bacterium]
MTDPAVGAEVRAEVRAAVRAALAELAARHPGRAVEVRVPPYGVVACLSGPRHTRGTPPNVVETDPETFLGLAAGWIRYADAVADGRVRASGVRADLTDVLPLTGTMEAAFPPPLDEEHPRGAPADRR